MTTRSPLLVSVTLLAGLLGSAAPAEAAEGPKACCTIVRISEDGAVVWLRNPGNGAVAALKPGPDDAGRFAIGSHYDPDTNLLDGAALSRRYPMVAVQLGPLNAKIIRARGAEMAAEMDETKTAYRIYALQFGRVLSSVKPGMPILIDEKERWAYIPVEGYGKVKASVWAFRLD